MTETFFTAMDDDGRRFHGEFACTGPWSSELMHGGPPSALLVRACERAAADAVPGQVALRASIDFLSAVRLGDVEVEARVVRAGRRITLTEARMTAGGRDALLARAWHVRLADDPTPELDQEPVRSVPAPAECPQTMTDWVFPYAQALEWRLVSGEPVGPGPAAVWSRARIGVVPGEKPSGLQRAVLTADSGNGLSANLDWRAWSFVNIDLDVHLSRPLQGEWVLLDARTRYEDSGTALAASVLHDEAGPVGRGAQSLVVTPQRG